MRNFCICNSERWKVIVWGNGVAIEIHSKALDKEIFAQGDNATEIITEYEALENHMSDDECWQRIWGEYYA